MRNSRLLNHVLFIAALYIGLVNNASVDSPGLYNQKDHVEVLTANNFKDSIINSNRAWLVEFYNSWCGFCQRFAPSWKDFADDVKGWSDVVVVAALDCSNEDNHVLCRDYEVMSYPNLRYFPEGFQEEPKNYGFVMNRGVTAEDHRHDLVKKLVNEQRAGRGKQFPNLLPFSSNSMKNVFEGTTADVKFSVLIVHEPTSLIGPELVLDLHKTHNITARYAFTNNTELASSLPSGPLPNIFVIDRNFHPMLLMPKTYDRQGMLEAIQENLKGKNIVFSMNPVQLNNASQEAKDESPTYLVRNMQDSVFQMDLETALRYSLKREVGSSKEITGEKLAALRKYLDVLSEYFPFGQNGKRLLQEISAVAKNGETIEGISIGKLVKEAEDESRQVFSTPQKWLGCQGSTPEHRGYPCGLWKLFHYLTVNVAVADSAIRDSNPRLALDAMHGYIKHFFGCADCSQHFQEMAVRRKIDEVATLEDAILWLWEAHNEVNKRLSGDLTEDPKFPKIEFPDKRNCHRCRRPDETWDSNEVLKYLKHMYGSVNIHYMGADTSIIFLGLEGNHTEGLQEEDVQLQARPIRKGLTVETNNDGLSSVATTKDKAYLKFILKLSILTTFCVRIALRAPY